MLAGTSTLRRVGTHDVASLLGTLAPFLCWVAPEPTVTVSSVGSLPPGVPSTQSTPLVSRARLGSALLVAVLTLAFNYGSEVTTAAGGAIWLVVGIAVAYPTLTAMGLLADRVRT